jgi:hypothetical protein
MELYDKIDQKAIEYHLMEGCNDFAAWIKDVFRDQELANEVADSHWWDLRKKLISKVLTRISDLKLRVSVDA